MPIPKSLKTIEAISQVYDWLGRPDRSILLPSVVCTRYWAQLDKLQLLGIISDRTLYLSETPITVAANQREVIIGEINPPVGVPVGLERLTTVAGVEQTCPIPLISDARDTQLVEQLSAFIYMNPVNDTRVLRFSRPLPETYNMRLWYEPAGFARPGLEERAPIPMEAQSLAVIETAEACKGELYRIYEASVARAYEDTIKTQAAHFRSIFEIWRRKNPGAGVRKRKPYRQGRRRNGIRVGYDYGDGS